MNGDYSSRSMELNCKRDINFMFLLEGHKAPDHATLARFRSLHFAPCSKRILAEVSTTLFDLGEISGETIFIDVTKIEDCALNALAIDAPLEYARLYLDGNLQMWVDAEDSLKI